MLQTFTDKQRSGLGAAAILTLTCLVYLPVLEAGFVWDDDLHVTDNPFIQATDGLHTIWLTTESYVYYPVAWSTLWVEYQLWGLNPTGYHVVNVLLHAMTALLVWRVLVLLALPAQAAWVGGVIFAVHPVNVESAAWITQHKNTLAMMWMMASLWFYLRADDGASRRYYLASIGAFVLAVLSKGAVVPFPGVLLVLAWWRRGKISKSDVMRSLPFWILAIAICLIEIWFQMDNAGDHVVRDDSLAARLAGAGWVVWFYLYKAVWPVNLIFIYPRWTIDAGSLQAWLPDTILVGVLITSWCYRRSWGKSAGAAMLCFIFMITPALGFADFYFLRYSYVADHYQYFAIAGFIAVVTGWLWSIASSAPYTRGIAAAVLIAVLSFMSNRQCLIYRDIETLWNNTLKKNPEAWMAHNNLGTYLFKQQRFQEANYHFNEALDLNHKLPSAHANLGAMAQRQGKLDEAIKYYQRALTLQDDLPMAHYGLGFIRQKQEQYDKAIKHYQDTLLYDPEHSDANNNLGVLLLIKARPSEALRHLRRALKTKPQMASAHANAAIALMQMSHPHDALVHAHQATAITGRQDAAMLDTLARVYVELGMYAPAQAVVDHALALPQVVSSPEKQQSFRQILRLDN